MTLIINERNEIEYGVSDELMSLFDIDDTMLEALLAASAWETMRREALSFAPTEHS